MEGMQQPWEALQRMCAWWWQTLWAFQQRPSRGHCPPLQQTAQLQVAGSSHSCCSSGGSKKWGGAGGVGCPALQWAWTWEQLADDASVLSRP
eukprot:1159043-Pelagomonas_calceolata.AAC.7